MANTKKKIYTTSVYVGTFEGKKKRQIVRASTKSELNRKVNEIKNLVQSGKDVYTTALFSDWAAKWYHEQKEPKHLSASALTVIQSTIDHLNRYFEKTQLKDITLSMFQQMINELAENNPNTNKPMSSDMLKKIKSNAQSIFEYAAANNIANVPLFFKSVMIPKDKAATTKRRALTEEEQQRIINTPHRRQLPAMIMLFSGLRRGECLALEWSDIDIQGGRIYVSKSLEFGKNQSTVKPGGKTANAVRTVPIPLILCNYLADYKNDLKAITKLVCVNASGKQYTKSSWVKTWDSYMTELNLKYGFKNPPSKNSPTPTPMKIEPFTPHYLRHTFATMLYLQDVDIVNAMQILGHSDIQTTVNIYTDFKTLNTSQISEDYKQHLKTDYSVKMA